ncbi:MAG: hypothetical protein V8R91_03220 [Butyricimonas faecihominis]
MDPFNALIITEFSGTVGLENLIEGETYKGDPINHWLGMIIIEFHDQVKAPACVSMMRKETR